MIGETLIYSVPGVSCEHCRAAISREVGSVAGVQSIDVDLEHKLVTVSGHDVSEPAARAAIVEAGYEAVEVREGLA